MASFDADIAIVGAGASGLAALADLRRAGCDVICLEARDRIGGRIYTLRDPFSPVPIELGAEFIHGRPPEIWDIARAHTLGIYDVAGEGLLIKAGRPGERRGSWDPVEEVMNHMRAAAASGPDRPFAEFLRESDQPEDVKRWATSYVEGFNAADRNIIGIASLAKDAQAADEIDGDAAFRILNGYDSVAQSLLWAEPGARSAIRLATVVESIEWKAGSVSIEARSALTGETSTVRCRRAVVTVPLGVLTAAPGEPGSIAWNPVPEARLEAAHKLAFGHVFRVVLRFREPFWEGNPELANSGFLISDENMFPTWWTTLAVRSSVLTGWSAGPHADPLCGKPREVVISQALASLARITGESSQSLRNLLAAAHFHDWFADPFARGAYSYVPAGALAARERLAEAVEKTLYFAGEATELDGHSATVHGAIRSGRRVARQLLEER